MFNKYKEILKSALNEELQIQKEFDAKREENTIDIRTKMKLEETNISKNQYLLLFT